MIALAQSLIFQLNVLSYKKKLDSKLLGICSVIDHKGCHNVVKTLLTHFNWLLLCVPLFGSYQDSICGPQLNR